jgi:hypothetical protein
MSAFDPKRTCQELPVGEQSVHEDDVAGLRHRSRGAGTDRKKSADYPCRRHSLQMHAGSLNLSAEAVFRYP